MTREFWYEFIQIYKSFPCLWDINNPQYVQKDVRKDAYEVLLAKVQEIDTSATLDFVKKKIDSFRTAFRREEKKVMFSLQSRVGDEPIYTPTLWYYRDLEEILGHNMDELKKQSATNESFHSEDDGDLLVERLESLSDDSDYTYEQPPPPKKRKIIKKKAELPGIFTQTFPEPTTESDKKDDCSTFAANLELQMREITVDQKYIAQKLISDVMFLARTNRLNYNSSVNSNESCGTGSSKAVTGTPVLIKPKKREEYKD